MRASVFSNLIEPARIATLLLSVALWVSCGSIPPLPPVNLSASGWRVRQGQAVWKPGKHKPELAGELLLATNAVGGCFIQFSKTPFTLATARIVNGLWQIEFGSGAYERHGHGQPPARFVWFQLPRILAGGNVQGDWRFEGATTNSWTLENRRTGERLEGGFFQ